MNSATHPMCGRIHSVSLCTEVTVGLGYSLSLHWQTLKEKDSANTLVVTLNVGSDTKKRKRMASDNTDAS